MKSLIKWIMTVTVLTVAFVAGTPAIKASAQDDYVSYQTFYDDLSPYGQWVSDPQYGDVFVPDIEGKFRPYYTNGHWAMTEYGNMWVSDYPWGWATFHYGRWTYDPYYGWVWIPGTEWAPAWVSWRGGGTAYGWAPLGPGVSVGMSFGDYECPDNWWVFVAPEYLYAPDFQRYWRGPHHNDEFLHSTSFVHNNYHNSYAYGPRAEEYRRITHQRPTVYKLSNGGRPGQTTINGNTVNVFRPAVRATTSNGGRPEPANVYRAPRAISTKPQAVAANVRPEFKTEVQNHQAQLLHSAPDRVQRNQPAPVVRQQTPAPVQPIPVPTQQPQRLQPQRVQPQQQPQRMQPQQQPQRMQPQQQPQRMQPQQQPQRMQPQQQPQRMQPQQQPQRMQPQQQPQRMQPQQQPQRMQPQQQPQRQMQAQPQHQQPAMRQEPRQATPAPRNDNGGRR